MLGRGSCNRLQAVHTTMVLYYFQLVIAVSTYRLQPNEASQFPGPLYGAIFNVVGIKPSYALSSVLMFVGFSACFYAPSLFVIQIFFGIAGALR